MDHPKDDSLSRTALRILAKEKSATESIYTHVISEDGKRVAAQLANAV